MEIVKRYCFLIIVWVPLNTINRITDVIPFFKDLQRIIEI